MVPQTPLRLLYLSNMAAPQQVSFNGYLQDHFEAHSWFYEQVGSSRPSWWRVPLPDRCRVLDGVYGRESGRYWCPRLKGQMEELNPDIVLLGGFLIPSNVVAYRWALSRQIPVVAFTETFRHRGRLRTKSIGSRLLAHVYSGLDAVLTSNEDAATQMREVLPTLRGRVIAARYAADLDGYLAHPARVPGPSVRLLFANRLIAQYNPLAAIRVLDALRRSSAPEASLMMNGAGELRSACEAEIQRLFLTEAVTFLDEIKAWSDLPEVYRKSEILLLPAEFSNGNFTVLEAMASGMGVVVSSRVRGLGELVRKGFGGFITEPTVEAMKDAVERYLAQPGLVALHADQNRRIIEPLTARGTARFYADLLLGLPSVQRRMADRRG